MESSCFAHCFQSNNFASMLPINRTMITHFWQCFMYFRRKTVALLQFHLKTFQYKLLNYNTCNSHNNHYTKLVSFQTVSNTFSTKLASSVDIMINQLYVNTHQLLSHHIQLFPSYLFISFIDIFMPTLFT